MAILAPKQNPYLPMSAFLSMSSHLYPFINPHLFRPRLFPLFPLPLLIFTSDLLDLTHNSLQLYNTSHPSEQHLLAHAHLHVHMPTNAHTCMLMPTHAHTCTLACTCTHQHVHVPSHSHAPVPTLTLAPTHALDPRAHVHVPTNACRALHTYTCTYQHALAHVHTHVCSPMCTGYPSPMGTVTHTHHHGCRCG